MYIRPKHIDCNRTFERIEMSFDAFERHSHNLLAIRIDFSFSQLARSNVYRGQVPD